MGFLNKLKIGGIIGAAGVGAAVGGAIGSHTGSYGQENLLGGAAIGGAAGALVAGNAKGIGNAALGGAATVGGAYLNAGAAVIDGAIKHGPGAAMGLAGGAAKIGAGAIQGVNHIGPLATLASPFRRHVSAAGNFAKSLVQFDDPTNNFTRFKDTDLKGNKIIKGVKLSNPISGAKSAMKMSKEAGGGAIRQAGAGVRGALINGQTVFWGSAAVSGMVGGFKEYNKSRMGTYDGQVTRATPRIPYEQPQQQNGGADGDLVFALNNLRNGGH